MRRRRKRSERGEREGGGGGRRGGGRDKGLKTERKGRRRKLVFTQRLDAVTLVVS